MKKPYIIALTVVAVIIIIVVLALLFVPNIWQGIVGERVSIKQASLTWEYNNIDKKISCEQSHRYTH